MSCTHKFEGCIIDKQDQPAGLITNTDGDYECPRCKDGWFWSSQDGSCQQCGIAINNCLECPSSQRCTRCEPGFFPSFMQDECRTPIYQCARTQDEYLHDGEEYVCPECRAGWYIDGNECSKCEIDDVYCLDCMDEDFCIACEIPKILNEEFTGCMNPLERCADRPERYGMKNDKFFCKTCEKNYMWSWEDWECQECGDVIDGCEVCRDNECHSCEGFTFPTLNRNACMEPLLNCADPIVPESYTEDLDKQAYRCTRCETGWYWNDLSWSCRRCNLDIDTYCDECNDDAECTHCVGGQMPEFGGKSCTQRFANCAESMLEDQPEGLNVEEGKFVCNDCEMGFYWDGTRCTECEIDNCLDCNDQFTCNTCEDGWLMQLKNQSCIPYFENCLSPPRLQPTGLDRDNENEVYFCRLCKDGYFYDELTRGCIACSDAISNCNLCLGADICQRCDAGLIPMGDTCSSRNIPGCAKSDSQNNMKCEMCLPDYSMSESRMQCGRCSQISPACTSCSLDNGGRPDDCLECIWPSKNVDGQCVWEECKRWIRVGDKLECEECDDTFGIMDGNCFKCESHDQSNEFWKDCKSCSIDWNNKAWDCLDCMRMKTLYEIPGGVTPLNQCSYPWIDFCNEMIFDQPLCDNCIDSYFSTGPSCEHCGIAKCNICLPKNDDSGLNDCTVCQPEFSVVPNRLNLNQDVCDWTNRIPYCEITNKEDINDCQQCMSGYFFDEDNIACVPCNAAIQYCATCSHNGTVCSSCEPDEFLPKDNLCWMHHCSTFSAGTVDFCTECDLGWFLMRLEGKCVDSCDPETHY